MNNDPREELLKDILEKVPKNPHGRLLLAPRSAKTRIAISLIERDKPKSVLWVTPSRELANKTIREEFHKWGSSSLLQEVCVYTTTYASLHKFGGFYDMIILDEEQCVTLSNIECIQFKVLRCNNILTMTGTPSKNKIKNKIYEDLNLYPIYQPLSIKEAVDKEILNNYNLYVVDCEMSSKEDIQVNTKSGKTFFTSELKEERYYEKEAESSLQNPSSYTKIALMNRYRYIGQSPSKKRAVLKLASKVTGKTLIFFPTIKMAESVCEYTYTSRSNDKGLNLFMEDKINILGLVGKGAIGFTYNNIKNIIIVQADSDNNGITSQKMCRGILKESTNTPNIIYLRLVGTKDIVWVSKALERLEKEPVIINLNKI